MNSCICMAHSLKEVLVSLLHQVYRFLITSSLTAWLIAMWLVIASHHLIFHVEMEPKSLLCC